MESFFNVADTEMIVLFKHPFCEFLSEFDGFVPAETGQHASINTRNDAWLLLALLKDIYGIRPVERKLRNTVLVELWLRLTVSLDGG